MWVCDLTLQASPSSKLPSCVDQTNLDLPNVERLSRYKCLIGKHQKESFWRLFVLSTPDWLELGDLILLFFFLRKNKKSTYWNKVFSVCFVSVFFFFPNTFETGARINLVCTLEIGNCCHQGLLILPPFWEIALHSESFNWICGRLVRISYSIIRFSDPDTKHVHTHPPNTRPNFIW